MLIKKKITREEIKILTITIIGAIAGTLGIDIHLASMPHIMLFMHTNKAHMQQSVSLFLLGLGASALVYGPLSDKYGRKPVMIFGLALATLASVAAAFTTNIGPFLLMRLLQGLGSGVCSALGRTIIADILQGNRMAVIGAYFSIVVSLSPLFAPALGGYIQTWFGWQMNFIVLALFLLFTLLLYVFFYPETNHHKNPRAFCINSLYLNYKSLLTHPVFIGLAIASGIAMAANMAYATTSSFIFQTEFHVTPIFYGWLTAIAGIAGILGKLTMGKTLHRLGSKHTLLTGVLLQLLGGVWICFFAFFHEINIPLTLLAVFAAIFGQVYIGSITSSRALSPFHEKRGSAGALYC